MAKHVEIRTVDDIDGSDAAELVRFSYRGKAYEIDLSEDNVRAFDEAMARFVAAARRAGGRNDARTVNPGPRQVRHGYDRDRAAAVREWATANGFAVSQRGRIPAKVLEAYDNRGLTTSEVEAEQEITQGRRESGRTDIPSPFEVPTVDPGTVVQFSERKRVVKGKPEQESNPGAHIPTDEIVLAWVKENSKTPVRRGTPTAADRKRYTAAHTVVKHA